MKASRANKSAVDILARLRKINVHAKNGSRSPHKPLLILLALGHVQRGEYAPLPFEQVEQELGPLISEFGPKNAAPRVHNPFWRLSNDGSIWTVESDLPIRTDGSGNPRISDLRKGKARAFFSNQIVESLRGNPELATAAAKYILNTEFPTSLHQEIGNAVGLELEFSSGKKLRSANFRAEVLRAYDRRCAVCRYQIRLKDHTVGLEAAHIKWHAFDGPDSVINGLALCPTHHKLFDLGAFSLNVGKEVTVDVSREVERSAGANDWLSRYSGRPIWLPAEKSSRPSVVFVEWHRSQVFKG